MMVSQATKTAYRRAYDGMELAKPLRLDRTQAACSSYEPEWWFSTDQWETEQALKVCNGSEQDGTPACPIRLECLQAALDNNLPYGVWGGLTEARRSTLRRNMRRNKT